MNYFLIVLLLLLSQSVSSETYFPSVSLSIQDFTGECDFDGVENFNIGEMGMCLSNFLSPAVDLGILVEPLSGDSWRKKVNAVSIFELDEDLNIDWWSLDVTKIPGALWNTPIVFLSIILEIIFSALKFIGVVVFRVMIVYVFWISLAFQIILNRLNQQDKFESLQTIQTSMILVLIGTIYGLAVGGGGLW